MRILAAAIVFLSIISTTAWADPKQDWKDCPKFAEPKRAITACSRIIKRRKESRQNRAVAYGHRCLAHTLEGQYDRAITDCTMAIKINPRLARVYIHRGTAYRGKNEDNRAIVDYNTAIMLDPKLAYAYLNRAHYYWQNDIFDQANADYTKAIELNPKYSLVYALLANDDVDGAIADFKRALELNPKLKESQEGLKRLIATSGAARGSPSKNLTLSLAEYLTKAGKRAKLISPGKLAIDGQRMACGRRPTVIDPNFESWSGAYPGYIILNTKKIADLPSAVKYYVYAQACGYQFVGREVLAADCFAAKRGRRYGWLKPQGVDAICEFLGKMPGDKEYPPGSQRCEQVRRCFDEAAPRGKK